MLFVFLLFVCPKVADVAAHANCTDQTAAAAAAGKGKGNGILGEQSMDSAEQKKQSSQAGCLFELLLQS